MTCTVGPRPNAQVFDSMLMNVHQCFSADQSKDPINFYGIEADLKVHHLHQSNSVQS